MLEGHTWILILHLLGFALSFGAILATDARLAHDIIRKGRINAASVERAEICTGLVTLGLAILYVSGALFIYNDDFPNSTLLTNPKLQAKLGIVLILSLNGLVLHRCVLPAMRNRRDCDLFDPAHRSFLYGASLAGVVSALSWWFAFVLGTAKELNFRYELRDFVVTYLSGLAIAGIMGILGVGLLARLRAREHASALAPSRSSH